MDPTFTPQTQLQPSRLELQNQLRREARKTKALAYREMKVAHANSI
jgi:hypothetical protein